MFFCVDTLQKAHQKFKKCIGMSWFIFTVFVECAETNTKPFVLYVTLSSLSFTCFVNTLWWAFVSMSSDTDILKTSFA